MSAQWSPERRAAIIDAIPLKRLGQPQDVAACVRFLVSEGAGFITGEIIDVNGGFLMIDAAGLWTLVCSIEAGDAT